MHASDMSGGARPLAVKTRGRLPILLDFDFSTLAELGTDNSDVVLVGVDEVGRGCLAGPVVAAAVILPDIDRSSPLAEALDALDDSKKLSAPLREALSSTLRANCRFAIGEASVKEIDKINILQASFLAMRRALKALALPATSLILVDGNKKIPKCVLKQSAIIDGDALSASIAAASVIAKVHRDALMCNLSRKYPHYKWESNKGYGSPEHRAAILEHGLTKLHRQKFCDDLVPQQLSLMN